MQEQRIKVSNSLRALTIPILLSLGAGIGCGKDAPHSTSKSANQGQTVPAPIGPTPLRAIELRFRNGVIPQKFNRGLEVDGTDQIAMPEIETVGPLADRVQIEFEYPTTIHHPDAAEFRGHILCGSDRDRDLQHRTSLRHISLRHDHLGRLLLRREFQNIRSLSMTCLDGALSLVVEILRHPGARIEGRILVPIRYRQFP